MRSERPTNVVRAKDSLPGVLPGQGFSDEALLQIHRADLIEDARRIYDDELARRQLVAARIKEESSSPAAADAGTDFPLDEDHPARPQLGDLCGQLGLGKCHRSPPLWMDERDSSDGI